MKSLAAAIPLRGIVLYPGMLRMLTIERVSSIRAIQAHLERDVPLVLVPQRDPAQEDVEHAEISAVGTLCSVLRITRMPDATMRVLFEGLERARLGGGLRLTDGFTSCSAERMMPTRQNPHQVLAKAREVAALFAEAMTGSGVPTDEQQVLAEDGDDPERLLDQVATLLNLSLLERIQLLEVADLETRLDIMLDHLTIAVAHQRIQQDVQSKMQAAMDTAQKEFHLKEQLKAIRRELGDALGSEDEADAFQARIEASGMPLAAREEAERELKRLRMLHAESPEYAIVRTWLDTMCAVPWQTETADRHDLAAAQATLDRAHYGLDTVKDRILEALAVRQLNPDSPGGVLCFVGPPGVGKTSLGRSIAQALGREFARLALGGIKDETEIRGHRRTYIGALPGRIVRALQRCGTRNPVIVLDEVDKLGADFRGDPASALLEVLDPEQNHAFVDHYLDVPVDLSKVLFIATANLLEPIPEALRDRLEVIPISGYTEEDKLAIAKAHLVPRLVERHGLRGRGVRVDSTAVQTIIREYTREAGLRGLEQQLAKIFRKVARRVVEGHAKRIRVTPSSVPTYLGPQQVFPEVAETRLMPGIATGLAWTAAGGQILFIEAIRIPGKPQLKLTGSLGDVMKESAEAALSWLKAHAEDHHLTPEQVESALHIHVPAGAIPKDGPSAGVALVAAIVSALTGQAIAPGLAMTGEISLRGRVLPVGGVKEKCLAARRAGLTRVLLPARNMGDLNEVPSEILADLDIVPVDHIDTVLAEAFRRA